MAEQRFNKGSEEWMMFMNYWKLCQKFWIVEKKDDYWDSLKDETNEFYEKYKNITLSKYLFVALVNSLEEIYRKESGI